VCLARHGVFYRIKLRKEMESRSFAMVVGGVTGSLHNILEIILFRRQKICLHILYSSVSEVSLPSLLPSFESSYHPAL